MNNNHTTDSLPNKSFFIKFSAENGKILGISPRKLIALDANELVVTSSKLMCKDLIQGKLNISNYIMRFNDDSNTWEIDQKSTVLEIKTRGTHLNKIEPGSEPGSSDMFIKIARHTSIVTIKVNMGAIRSSLNLGQIQSIKNTEAEDLLDIYICKRNDPDYLIGIIHIDAYELLREKHFTVQLPDSIKNRINDWNEISLYTKPVFQSYGIEYTDVDFADNIDNSRLHSVANTNKSSHINICILNNKLVITSIINPDMLYYFENKRNLDIHISDGYVDNYVDTLSINTIKLIDNKTILDVPIDWPTTPIFTFKNTQLTINYDGEINEQHDQH